MGLRPAGSYLTVIEHLGRALSFESVVAAHSEERQPALPLQHQSAWLIASWPEVPHLLLVGRHPQVVMGAPSVVRKSCSELMLGA